MNNLILDYGQKFPLHFGIRHLWEKYALDSQGLTGIRVQQPALPTHWLDQLLEEETHNDSTVIIGVLGGNCASGIKLLRDCSVLRLLTHA